ncbi:pyridoxamine 5'-phosphate oxidase-related, FMN-binding [Roseibium sp. TrichSKD4]|uniref:pyridoxamine 5'-phosphate oxidase family protein n=1 Tax=Roseibium sp. TrichSKD4 TaxID=744980 RepID=UPI0001E562A2|nr:pyridoxamine 5'-phosphate oxidase family protein [Roseibium sp. TrichSKD4]EFO33822.1 pyridoxamine 5'-phosphate oxidase-related, FMN-binding [Roseibium sp. TrichSKD4]
MSFYTTSQRSLQEQFGTRKLADTVEQAIVWDVVEGPAQAFIESRDFFFLSTVDGVGRPTVSYKGGPVGIVHVRGPKTLLFPAYDGNGMFKSLGNIADTGKVGMLFIDFETPNRVRVQGEARLVRQGPELDLYPGAFAVVEVEVEHCFLNCARYVHRYNRVEASPYVPDACGDQPHPSWKRIDFVQGSLGAEDRERTQSAGGEITMEDYMDHLIAGKS